MQYVRIYSDDAPVDFAPPAPRRQMLFYLAGEIEAETSDGEVRRFGAGSVTLVEDTAGKGHRSRVIGGGDVLLAAVQLPD